MLFYRIDAPNGQYIYLYQSAPQLPLLALRQDEGTNIDYWTQINNWWNGVQQGFNQSEYIKMSI